MSLNDLNRQLNKEQFLLQIEKSIVARNLLFTADEKHLSACRLFNGHLEGYPELVIDLYGTTVLFHNFADPPGDGDLLLRLAQPLIKELLPWVESIVLKDRNGVTPEAKQGYLLDGEKLVDRVRESGVWYAVDLQLNRDASFYLDTRTVRHWLQENSAEQNVFNTFAYTGSLGVAAQAGGASRVVHTDLNRRFLNVAKTSYTLNGYPIQKQNFQTGDFFPHVNRLKKEPERFDCVILDPPFFSSTDHSTVDMAHDSVRLINKLRPLVKDGGRIIAINNALYLSGADYMHSLQSLCENGFVAVEEIIPVPEDITGYPHTVQQEPVSDPAPFNHSTKIVVLRIFHNQRDMS